MIPPRFAQWLVVNAARPGDRDALRDELSEEYGRRIEIYGRRAASRWYRRQVLRSLGPLLGSRLRSAMPAVRAHRATACREGVRSIVRHPRISATCIVTLAVASGASLAAGTIVHTVVLRELPFAGGERIVALWNIGPQLPAGVRAVSFQDLEDWRARSTTLEAVSGETGEALSLTGRGDPRRIAAARVARDFDRVLGISAQTGRLFEPRDFQAGAHYVAVLTHGFWQQEFGGSLTAIGQKLTLNDRPYEIVGVLPQLPTSLPSEPHDVWVPLIPRPGVRWESSRATGWLNALGRLRPGVSIEAARDEVSAIAASLSAEYPASNAKRVGMEIRSLREEIALDIRRPLFLFAGAVAAVLVVAWANLINLLMTHATTRRREFAVRLAIGADRRVIVGQIFVECLIVSAVGAGAGLAATPALIDGFLALYPGVLWRAGELASSGATVIAAAIFAVASAVLLALPQLRYLADRSLTAEVRQDARITASRLERNARAALVMAQMAFCVVLLTCGVVFWRTLTALGSVQPGFDADSVLVFEVTPSSARFGSAAQAGVFFRQVHEALGALPGVRRVAAGTSIPFTSLSGWQFGLESNATAGAESTLVEVVVVSPGFFETLGIPIVEGRTFADIEHAPGGPPVVMMNDTLARLLHPVRRTSGTIEYGGAQRIVGVVGNTRDGLREPAAARLYLPWHQAGRRPQGIVVKADTDPLPLLPAIANRIHTIDPGAPIARVARLAQLVERSLAPQRFRAAMVAVLAGIALVLAALGVYSVTAFTLSVQDKENSIRRALGEPPRVAAIRILGSAVAPAAAGALVGAVVAAAMAPSFEALLYEVSGRDPAVIAGVAIVLLLVAVIAGAVPARAAMRLDPASVLRAN